MENKTEHEDLNKINQLIGYQGKFIYTEHFEVENGLNGFIGTKNGSNYEVDIREIIFDPKFIIKLVKKHLNKFDFNGDINLGIKNTTEEVYIGIMKNLDNPVQYITNLLKNDYHTMTKNI